jgi:hypothetical protein
MIRILKVTLVAPLILAAALVVGPSRVSFAQGDADLEAPGLEPFAAPVSGGTTLFQNVRTEIAAGGPAKGHRYNKRTLALISMTPGRFLTAPFINLS